LNKSQQAEGVRMGIEVAKHKATLAMQQAQHSAQRQQQSQQKPPKKG
jgi:hypothetical protein